MDEFFRLPESLEEEAAVVVTAAVLLQHNLELGIDIYPADDSPIQTWRLTCLNVRDHTIRLGDWGSNPELHREHVLLWQFQKPVVSLYFHHARPDPDTFVGALYARNLEIMGTWAPFDRWFNGLQPIHQIIRGGYGLLAVGPEPLISGYDEVMKKFGFRTSLLSHLPKHWDGEQWVDASSELVALTIGRMHVVATQIRSERITREGA